MRNAAAGPWEVTAATWEQSLKLIPYNYSAGCQRTQPGPFCSHWAFEANWKSEKSSLSGCLRSWPKIKKLSFWSVVYSMQWQQTISQSGCDVRWQVDFIWQLVTTSSVVEPRRSSRALPKAKLAPEKVMVTGGLLPVWSPAAFWIPVKPLHLRSTLSKPMRCTDNSTPALALGSGGGPVLPTTVPDCTSHNQRCRSWVTWAVKFCLIRHIHLTFCQLTTSSSLTFRCLTTTSLSILTTFCKENTTTGGRKCFPRVCGILKYRFLCYKNKQTFLIGENVLIVMVPVLINKDVCAYL